ncbi:MAG: glycosyltransferase family 2 protein [Candidatus Saccharimonadales bacterium]
MSAKSSSVSVVILSWNTLNETKDCLESIRRLDYPAVEIIVVDNGSRDGSKEYLAAQKDIVYIDLPKNTGFTGGQIAAYEKANGDFIALINSDALVDKNWLRIGVEVMRDSRVAAVGGKAYIWQDGEEPYKNVGAFYSYQAINLWRGYATTMTAGEKQLEVDSISGAGVLIRRKTIEEVGYFDKRFFAYFEETDLFARMQRAGYRIVYEPTMHTWHKIASSTKDKPYFLLYYMNRNRFLFAIKNFDKEYARSFFWFYAADGIRAFFRYLTHRDLDNRARTHSLFWNLGHLFETLADRRKVSNIGPTYTSLLQRHHAADDITVIIPCHNYEDYLGDAIESVLGQTHKPSRIIVIDDGSTDGSRKVAKRYADRGVELISKDNSGVIATKNLGIELTTTSWTVFLDADDILEPEYLEMVYKRSVSGKYDVVYTDLKYFGTKNEILRAGSYNFNRFIGTGNFVHNSALILTSYLKQVGGYKDVMRGGYEDWELYITLAEAGARFGYVAKPLLRYRQHGQHGGRNANAEAEAKRLWNTVHDLHGHSFRQYNFSFYKVWKMIIRTIQNPLLPLVAIAILPLCLLAAVKAFFVTFGKRFSYRTRNYLHRKDEIERATREEEDLQWPDSLHES